MWDVKFNVDSYIFFIYEDVKCVYRIIFLGCLFVAFRRKFCVAFAKSFLKVFQPMLTVMFSVTWDKYDLLICLLIYFFIPNSIESEFFKVVSF